MPHQETASGPVLRKTDDYNSVRVLALRSGLEDGTFENIVTAYGYYIDSGLVGCVALKQEESKFSVEWLAVSEELRGKGIGGLLVGKIEAEAKARGAARIWALARAPRFFEKIGFRKSTMDELGGPTMSNCLLCSQFQTSCFPAVVVKDL